MAVVENNAEHAAAQRLGDLALQFDLLFLVGGGRSSCTTENWPALPVQERGPGCALLGGDDRYVSRLGSFRPLALFERHARAFGEGLEPIARDP